MKLNKLLNSLATLTLVALSVSIFSNVSTVKAAFGVSPPWVKNNHLLPGTTFEQVIYLSRNEPKEEMKVAVTISGDEELVEWIQIQDEENLIMKKGQTLLPMKVIINVSESAATKNYIGGIFVSLSPLVTDTSLGGGEVAIGLGAHISVDISVIGDKVTDYEIRSASVEPQEQDNPLSVNVEVENKGNTEISSLKGQIDIYNSTNTEILKSLTFVPFEEPVFPDETKEIEMIFQDFKPDPGEYWVAVKAFKDEEVIYEDRFLKEVKAEIIPVITPEDTIAETRKISLIFGLAGLVIALAALVGVIAVLILKKRAKNNL